MAETDVAWDTSREAEIAVLAELAAATATAISRGHLERALELADIQSIFLSRHSLACLGALVSARPCADAGLDGALEMLDELLRADQRLLVEPGDDVSVR